MRLFLVMSEAHARNLKLTCIPLGNALNEKYEFE